MNKLPILIILIAFALSPAQLLAQDVPIDSLVAWFQNYCDQTQQLNAFGVINTPISESDTYYSTPSPAIAPYRMVRVKKEYDTSLVKDAFENFVRSITIADCTKGCGTVIQDPYLYGSDGEGNYTQDVILSLYAWWGFTTDFNKIVDKLYVGVSYMDGYYSYLWNKIGPSYFNYLKLETKSDTSFLQGSRIACAYLEGCDSPIDTLKSLAIEIIHEGVLSKGVRLKKLLSYRLVDIYLKGYDDLYEEINTLWDDPANSVNKIIDYEIRKQQRDNHLLMEFQKSEE